MKPNPTKSALLEIGVEELPARFVPLGLEQLKNLAQTELTKNGLDLTGIEVWGTPRRLALLIKGLPLKARDREDIALGPPPKAAKDSNGQWTEAALGFAKAQKVSVEKLKVQNTPKGERYVAIHQVRGQSTESVLKTVCPTIITQLNFPKTMTWEPSGLKFPRPIRWIVAMFHTKVVRFTLAGIQSDKNTWGLLALGGKKIPITKIESYVDFLRSRCILVNPEDRKEKILGQIETISKKIKPGTKAIITNDLLEEVIHLTEYPVGIRAQFEETYLSLPRELLISVLRKHQKFFPVESGRGELMTSFIGFRNGPSEHQEGVKEGYERVTRARLADAHFFFEHDKKVPLESLVPKLDGVSFIEGMGTMKDKSERVKKLALDILSRIPSGPSSIIVERAAALCKTDLLTHIVGEFPELQGIAGRIYSNLSGEKDVGDAIEQHYWPLSADGTLPTSKEGALLAVADKIDTIAANFSLGLIPSGSQDPFGLRRSAIGIIRIILDQKWPLSVATIIESALQNLPEKYRHDEKLRQSLISFLIQRTSAWLQNQGFKFDEIDAVLSSLNQPLVSAIAKLKDLSQVRNRPEFDSLSIAIKRAANILKQAKEKNILPEEMKSLDDDTLETREVPETKLVTALKETKPKVALFLETGDYHGAFLSLASLKDPVDAFFEGVMVMVEDPLARQRRLSILYHVKTLFDSVADFSKLQSATPQNDVKPAK